MSMRPELERSECARQRFGSSRSRSAPTKIADTLPRLTEGEPITARIDDLEIPHPVRPVSDIAQLYAAPLQFREVRINAPELDVCHCRPLPFGRACNQIERDRVAAYVCMGERAAPLPPQCKSQFIDVERQRLLYVGYRQPGR